MGGLGMTTTPASRTPATASKAGDHAYPTAPLRKCNAPYTGECLDARRLPHRRHRRRHDLSRRHRRHLPTWASTTSPGGLQRTAPVCSPGRQRASQRRKSPPEGPVPAWKYFWSPATAGKARTSPATCRTAPRFNHAEFTASFPFASIRLKDNDIPIQVDITAWSPFIPTDEDNSSLPVRRPPRYQLYQQWRQLHRCRFLVQHQKFPCPRQDGKSAR